MSMIMHILKAKTNLPSIMQDKKLIAFGARTQEMI